MAGPVLCVSCAQLPLKGRSAAFKTMKCADCKNEFGVTSYGVAFRIEAAKHRMLLSPSFLIGATLGAGLFTFALVLAGLGFWSRDQMVRPARAPDLSATEQLARVREVAVDKTFEPNIKPTVAKQQIQGLIARIRDDNKHQQDAFVLTRMKERPELRGLPFVMGDACRLNMGRAQSFQNSVEAVRTGLERDMRSASDVPHREQHNPFWNTYLASTANQGIDTDHGVAALAQVLGPEGKTMRFSLVERLKLSNRPEATRTIARAAVFDSSGDVRLAATKALKERNKNEDVAIINEILMHGIRYPLPVIAGRARDAMLALDRKELLPQLVAFLGEPAPGDPEEREAAPNQKECVVREVVKINHHRNCLLCHPPSQTGQPVEVPGVIPIPGNPFPSSPREAYGAAQSSGEPMVRADTTYLRQDFSVLMAVPNAAPWPEMQRFDFLVRTRVVEGDELASLRQGVQARAADFLSANHKAAVEVLQELTGRRDVAPNRAAWQRALAAGE